MTAAVNTPDRVIRAAMEDAGLLEDGDDPTPEQYAKYLPRLNELINYLQTQGIKLWLQSDLTVPLVLDQGLYTLSPTGDVVMTKPLRVIQAYYLDSNNIQRPLVTLSRDEYTRLSNVAQSGTVNSYFVDKQQTSLNVYLWLRPDSTAITGTVHLIIQNQVTNMVAITDSMNFPQEWFMALHWMLADDISTGQPKSVIDRCQMRAQMFINALEAWDVEDASTMFTPDPRSAYITGAFR